MIRGLALALACLAMNAWAADPVSHCRASAKPADCARDVARHHVVKHPDFWRSALSRPIAERIGPAPPDLIEFLALDNLANGYPNVPRAPRLDPAFLHDVQRAFEGIPGAAKRGLESRLAGIYFVDDIGGTGFTDETLDPAGRPVAGFMILDPTVLAARTANAWATWKESSPFKADPSWRLEARIENAPDDDRMHAIQYILLHELGHVHSIGTSAHPRWTVAVKDYGPADSYPFFAMSWVVKGDRWESIYENAFPQRKDVRFYFGARLPGDSMVPVYEALEKTNFPTLYAATHFGDDFAEAFASYVHVVLMKRPYEIRILRDGKVAKAYGPCWREERCAGKKAYLERFLAGK